MRLLFRLSHSGSSGFPGATYTSAAQAIEVVVVSHPNCRKSVCLVVVIPVFTDVPRPPSDFWLLACTALQPLSRLETDEEAQEEEAQMLLISAGTASR